jgi:hypothetical protein
MPSSDSKPPVARPLLIVLALIVLGAVIVVGLKLTGHIGQTQSNQVQVVTAPSQPASNATTAAQSVFPGTPISAATVLEAIDQWLAQHPNYHSSVETVLPSGTVMGKMDVYGYVDGTNGEVVRMKAQMMVPEAVDYQAEKENGKLDVYFPKTDQLIEPDMSKMLVTMPALAANQSGLKGLLKLAKSSFAESSEDLRVATMVFSAEALHLPDTSGDVYISLRSDNEGKLLGVEEQAQGQRLLTVIKYLSFDRDLVMRDAPAFPVGKVAVTNKTLQAAMKEEILSMGSKPLRTKI